MDTSSPSMSQYDLQFTHTPLLPSQLLIGSPFQPGTPALGQFSGFMTLPTPAQMSAHLNSMGSSSGATSPVYSPGGIMHRHQGHYSHQSHHGSSAGTPPPSSHRAAAAAAAAAAMNAAAVAANANYYYDDGQSRTVYLGNIPAEATAEEILNHVRSGIIENFKILPEKNCAFVSFLDASSAAHFHSDAILKHLTIKGQEVKIGWGRSSPIPPYVSLAVSQEGASRNVYLGALPQDITEDEIRQDLSRYGPIDCIRLVRDKKIGFVHFLSISSAIQCVLQLPLQDTKWVNRKVYYGKDRCAYISKTQQQNAAQYLGISPGYEHIIGTGPDREILSNSVARQSAAAVAIASSAGGINNVGNRTVYLGNVHPETTIEEICNIIRGGLLHNIRYIPARHICFVTFIDPTAAAQFYATSVLQGLSVHNRRMKVGWGKHSGPLMNAIALAVSAGASRNVYIGNIDQSFPESKLRKDFGEFGETEQINFLPEKSCAFVNFTNITNAIKAIEGIKEKEDYKNFVINFGKDRCGNPPRQVFNKNSPSDSQSVAAAAAAASLLGQGGAEESFSSSASNDGTATDSQSAAAYNDRDNEHDDDDNDNANGNGNDKAGLEQPESENAGSSSYINNASLSPPSSVSDEPSLNLHKDQQLLQQQLLQIQQQQHLQHAAAAAASAALGNADYANNAQQLLNQYLLQAQHEQYLYAAAVAAAAAAQVPPPPPPHSSSAAVAAAAAAQNGHSHFSAASLRRRSVDPSSTSSSLTSSSFPPTSSTSDITDTTNNTVLSTGTETETLEANEESEINGGGAQGMSEQSSESGDTATPTDVASEDKTSSLISHSKSHSIDVNGSKSSDEDGKATLKKLEQLKVDDGAVYGLAIE